MSSAARRWCGASDSGSSVIISAAMRTVVSGVRSSWETSEVNCRCRSPYSSSCVICLDNLSAMSLNELASRPISSSLSTGMRSRRWPAAKRCAMREAERIGVMACWVASHAMPTSSTTMTTPAAERSPRISAIVDSSLSIDITR